jgi:hypothetical protein
MRFLPIQMSRSRANVRRALIWPGVQISAGLLATNAKAARLNEPLASLGRLVQTGVCTPSSPFRSESCMGALSVSAGVSIAHPRFDAAHWPEPLTAPVAAQACPTCLPSPSNQRTVQDDSRLEGRRFERTVRCASVSLKSAAASVLDSFPLELSAGTRGPWTCGHCAGRAPRVLGPVACADAAMPRNFSDLLDFARPFDPSSRLRAAGERIDSRAFSTSRPESSETHFGTPRKTSPDGPGSLTFAVVPPVPNDRQDCTFPRKSAEAGRWRSTSRRSCACQARFGGSLHFSKPLTSRPKKHYGTQA